LPTPRKTIGKSEVCSLRKPYFSDHRRLGRHSHTHSPKRGQTPQSTAIRRGVQNEEQPEFLPRRELLKLWKESFQLEGKFRPQGARSSLGREKTPVSIKKRKGEWENRPSTRDKQAWFTKKSPPEYKSKRTAAWHSRGPVGMLPSRRTLLHSIDKPEEVSAQVHPKISTGTGEGKTLGDRRKGSGTFDLQRKQLYGQASKRN